MNIGIVVVTYNRLECLKKNVESLENIIIPEGCKVKIFIINNASTDETTEWLASLNNNNIKIVNLDTNTGGAGGFYTGIKIAIEEKMDYIWGMDDDAYQKKKALVEIINAFKKEKDVACFWSNCNNDEDFDKQYKQVKNWMFVGFFIPVEVVKKIGYPRKDFFIFYDDVEYSDRIQKNGYKIYKVKDSIIQHKDAYSNTYKRKIFNKNIEIPSFKDWKMYYYIRNKLLRYSKKEKEYWHNALIIIPKIIVKVLILNPKQLKIVLKAYVHGIIRKNGKIVEPF